MSNLVVIITSIIGLVGIVIGTIYLIPESIPETPSEKFKKILAKEQQRLDNLEGDSLYSSCIRISSKGIPSTCGDLRLDAKLKWDLVSYAWAKVEKLAYNGEPYAQYMLAKYYSGDFGEISFSVSYNYEKAAYWYLQAAEQGLAAAQCRLGKCYFKGKGVEEDIEEAIKWYKRSAENGDEMGQLELGDCFRDGYKQWIGCHWERAPDSPYYNWSSKIGYEKVNDYKILITQNIDSAKYYWRKSAAQGNQKAKDRLEKIYE